MRTKISIFFAAAFLLFVGCQKKSNTVVEIATEQGNITVELFEKEAPVTCANFIKLVNEGTFKDGRFYRVVAWIINRITRLK